MHRHVHDNEVQYACGYIFYLKINLTDDAPVVRGLLAWLWPTGATPILWAVGCGCNFAWSVRLRSNDRACVRAHVPALQHCGRPGPTSPKYTEPLHRQERGGRREPSIPYFHAPARPLSCYLRYYSPATTRFVLPSNLG